MAVSVLAALAGAWGVRVHAVRDTVDAVEVAREWGPEGVPTGPGKVVGNHE